MKKYFKDHLKSKHWDYKKNKYDITKITLHSGKKCWFICEKCNHSFIIEIDKITSRNQWCCYCSSKKLCNCEICLKKSFSSHKKSKFWDYNKNKISPKEIFLKSDKKGWFICNNCNHKFEIVIKNITEHNKWCSYCSSKKLCDCNICLNKSFSSNLKSKFWDYEKNNKKPNEVFKNARKKYWFICKKNHSFNAALYMISGRNTWCPLCKNKTEMELYEWLKLKYKINYQARYKWCKSLKTNRYLPFDFVIEELKIIIELDGPQHFIQISNWQSPDIIQKRDIYKEECAIKNGYKIIRILQEDIYYNRINWKKILQQKIEDI